MRISANQMAALQAALVELVRFAIHKADHYGFGSECEIVMYLSVMIPFGARFDEDPRFKQLHLPLAGMGRTPPSIRIEFLVAMADELPGGDRTGYR